MMVTSVSEEALLMLWSKLRDCAQEFWHTRLVPGVLKILKYYSELIYYSVHIY